MFQGQSEVVQGNLIQNHKRTHCGNGIENDENFDRAAGGKPFFPVFFVRINDAQESTGGGESKECDTDDHKR